MSISKKINKQMVRYSYSGIIFSIKNIHNKDESQNTVISKEVDHERVHTICSPEQKKLIYTGGEERIRSVIAYSWGKVEN